MSDTFLVRLLGILPGFTLDNVIAKLSNLFGKSPEAIRGLLASPGATIKRGVDSATASRYQTALEQCGCQCLLEAERRWTNIPAADFAAMSLQRFVGARLGVVVNAPASWRDASDEQYFQLVDPQTGTQLTAGGYENPGMTLEQWAEARLGTVAEAMPYLSIRGQARINLLYVYDEAGHLQGEYGATGAPVQETVWFGDIPVATLRPTPIPRRERSRPAYCLSCPNRGIGSSEHRK